MKERKLKIFLVTYFLIQYYFLFKMIDQAMWFNSTIWAMGFYFGSNVAEGIYGKEKVKIAP